MINLLVVLLLLLIRDSSQFDVLQMFLDLTDKKDQNVPQIQWPNRFEATLSNNNPGINITEKIYFDSIDLKLRIQIYYSVLSLEPSLAMDLTFDENNKLLGLRTDQDCKKTTFTQSLDPIQKFFQNFHRFTDFQGIDGDLQKYLIAITDGQTKNSPKFQFFFKNEQQNKKYLNLQHVKMDHKFWGSYQFDALHPIRRVKFSNDFFSMDDCEEIHQLVLEEAMTFVTFMYSVINELLGKEGAMVNKIMKNQQFLKQDAEETKWINKVYNDLLRNQKVNNQDDEEFEY